MEVGRQEPDPGNVNELTPPFVTSQLKVLSFHGHPFPFLHELDARPRVHG